MDKSVIQMNSGLTKNFNVSAKIQEKIMCARNIIFGILLHVVIKMVNM